MIVDNLDAHFPREVLERIVGAPCRSPVPLPSSRNVVWRFESQGELLVARWAGRRPLAPVVDLRREALLQGIAAGAEFAPPVIAVDLSEQVLVTRYLSGGIVDDGRLRSTSRLGQLASRLRELHALTVADVPQQVSLSELIDAYQRCSAPGPETDAAIVCLEHADLPVDKLALCHHDVRGANLIDQTPLKLIDWEYARIAHPMFDLAVAAENLALTESQVDVLSRHYFDGDNAESIEMLDRFRGVVRALFTLWARTAHH